MAMARPAFGPAALVVITTFAILVQERRADDMSSLLAKMRNSMAAGTTVQPATALSASMATSTPSTWATAQPSAVGVQAQAADWRDSSSLPDEPHTTEAPTVTGFLSNTAPKNRAVVTGVVTGAAVSALAGGIAIAIEETEAQKRIQQGLPPKPLFPWVSPKPSTAAGPVKPKWKGAGRHSIVTIPTAGSGHPPPPHMKAREQQKGQTTLSAPAAAGATVLEVASVAGFTIGSTIMVGDEYNVIKGFSSIILQTPLAKSHPSGAVVKIVPATTPRYVHSYSPTLPPTTTIAPRPALGDEIPLPVWIALGVLVCCCCAALAAALVEACNRGGNKKGKRKKKAAPPAEIARSDSASDDGESYYDQSPSYAVVAPYGSQAVPLVAFDDFDYSQNLPPLYSGGMPTNTKYYAGPTYYVR